SFVMSLFFFLNDLTPTYIYTLSLHDALPILVRDEPLVGLTGAPVLAEFRKHQLDCRLNPQIRIFDDAILASTPVSRRYDAEQFPAPRLLFLSPQEPVFENLQFHHAQCPLDAQHQL